MFTRILYPTDGSDVAECTLDWAIDLAGSTGSEIFVLHVVEDGKNLDHNSMELLTELGEEIVQTACKRIEDRGIIAHPVVAEGKPYHGIIDLAKSTDVRMIVMGTHGTGGLTRALLGSVADTEHPPALYCSCQRRRR
jgi:nucleotide-binding universal stress UspA family protein